MGQTIVLIDETFNPATFPPAPPPTWTSSVGPFETYNQTGANVRDMANTYDHDNNIGTAQILIPGGIEVNDNGSNVTVTATVTLPNNASSGLLTFWAGSRGDVAGQQISIFDITDSTMILAPTNVNINTVGNPNQWQFNSFTIPFTAANWGDTIAVRFIGNGNGAQGLQLTDLDFTVGLIPEPASIALWSLLGVGLVVGGYYYVRRK